MSETTFPTLPVSGYTPQPRAAVDLVNRNKEMEERVLRLLDDLAANAAPGQIDGRWFAIGRTHIEQGFMALNRSVFKPTRISLPEDEPPPPAMAA